MNDKAKELAEKLAQAICDEPCFYAKWTPETRMRNALRLIEENINLASLIADKERLDWLDNNHENLNWIDVQSEPDEPERFEVGLKNPELCFAGVTIRQAIDAAINSDNVPK